MKYRIATSMLKKLKDEAKDRGIHQIWLSASTLGRPVYEHFGFVMAEDYMKINL